VFLILSSFSNVEIIKGQTLKPIIISVKKSIDEKHRGEVSLLSKTDSQMISLPLFYLYSKEKREECSGCSNSVLQRPNSGSSSVVWNTK
jgi:hypothetical protein